MINSSEVLISFIQIGLACLVCSVVWIVLIVGMGQLLRDIYNQIRPAQKRIRRLHPSQQVSH